MQRRLDMIRRHMETNGIDACVFTSYHNIHYYSDFLYCYFGRPYALIVTPSKTTSVSAGKLCCIIFFFSLFFKILFYSKVLVVIIDRLGVGRGGGGRGRKILKGGGVIWGTKSSDPTRPLPLMRDNDQSSTFCFLIFPAMFCSSVGGGGGRV